MGKPLSALILMESRYQAERGGMRSSSAPLLAGVRQSPQRCPAPERTEGGPETHVPFPHCSYEWGRVLEGEQKLPSLPELRKLEFLPWLNDPVLAEPRAM